MLKNEVSDTYFEWMVDIATKDKPLRTYNKLLSFLHDTPFTYTMRLDSDRAADGLNLRWRFALHHPEIEHAKSYLRGPCSVFEMILALAIRCEETIMCDEAYGDRTTQWFWGMIVSLGLGGMDDECFDEEKAEQIITRFLAREYEPNGKGGLFTIKETAQDLRDVEIWCQLCWYLNTIS